jgi:spore coat protein CotH
LRFEGEVLENVGVRAKGGCGSARGLDAKAAFKVNLEWDDPAVPGCPPKRRLYGLKNLTLNNGIQDPSGMHERMIYRFYIAAGVPAPRAVNARLVVNGEYWGLYVLVETIDRPFIKRWFRNSRGMMYEGAYWCDLIEQNVPLQLDGETCFQREFVPSECDDPPEEGDDPQDWELLRQLTQRFAAIPPGQLYPTIPSFFDFDSFLTMAAVESVTCHWDGYPWELNNNYRVYHDPVLDRWTMIPWGTDQTFVDDFEPWEWAAGVISVPCLQDPACEAAFAERLHEMAELFEQLDFAAEAVAMRDQIAVHVEEDPRKEYDYAEWEWVVSDMLVWIEERPQRVRQILAAHGY